MKPLDELEIFELMQAMFPEKYPDEEDETYYCAIRDWEDMDINDVLSRVVPRLIMLAPTMESPMTGERYHVLGKEKDGYFTAIIKREAS